MSPSKAFKNYVKKLANSGLPTCATQLKRLSDMGQKDAFQWFLANKYSPAVDKLASNDKGGVQDFVNGILADEDDDEGDEAIVEEKPKAKRRRAKTVDVMASDEDSTWKASLFGRYGIEAKIGSTFQSKKGTTFIVTAVADDHIRAARQA